MAIEEIIVQTADEVSKIDYRKNTNDMISTQTEEIQNNISAISEQLDTIVDNSYGVSTDGNIDLSQVTDMIDSIDTTLVEANTQDILMKLNTQQQQINDINNKLDLILNKL